MKKNIVIGLLLLMAFIGFLKRDYFWNELTSRPSFKNEILTIVMSTPALDLSPESLDLGSRTRTANIYETLVIFDKNLKVVPALALSWGNLSPTSWEFKLRREVVFHNGHPFNASSVIESFESVQAKPEGIQAIRKTDDHTLQIETKGPDPLLLSKLTRFFIARPGNQGTGPYEIREWVPGEVLSLKAFPHYWGRQPVYRNAEYQVMEDRTERRIAFENGKIDVLAAVPRDQALELPQEQLKKSFGLEVNFLMFKLDDLTLRDWRIREAIRTLLDPAKIEAIGNYFVRPVNQFVAPGVFGYNPAIPEVLFDESKKAKNLFGSHLERVTLDYLETYSTLSEYLAEEMETAGFLVKKNPLPPAELLERIRRNESQLYLLGWQAEDGDAGGFLDAFIHSAGEFNGGRYKNPEVDGLIEASRQEMDPQERLALLQDIMQKIQGDLIGIPLFEASRIYAVKPGVEWEPRVDGLVLAAEVK